MCTRKWLCVRTRSTTSCSDPTPRCAPPADRNADNTLLFTLLRTCSIIIGSSQALRRRQCKCFTRAPSCLALLRTARCTSGIAPAPLPTHIQTSEGKEPAAPAERASSGMHSGACSCGVRPLSPARQISRAGHVDIVENEPCLTVANTSSAITADTPCCRGELRFQWRSHARAPP